MGSEGCDEAKESGPWPSEGGRGQIPRTETELDPAEVPSPRGRGHGVAKHTGPMVGVGELLSYMTLG